MKNQLVLFELKPLPTELVAVWRQLTSEKRGMATQLLAEMMSRTVVESNSERNTASGKGGSDE